jgi:hypothetical protein
MDIDFRYCFYHLWSLPAPEGAAALFSTTLITPHARPNSICLSFHRMLSLSVTSPA